MKSAMEPVHPGAMLREDILKEMDASITKAAAGWRLAVNNSQK